MGRKNKGIEKQELVFMRIINKSDGFTLVELIVVIVILGIIAVMTFPRIAEFKSKAEESVCDTNRKTVERVYSTFLVEKDISHEDNIFNQFLINNYDEVCPEGGVIIYEDGKVMCSMHEYESKTDEDKSNGEEAPWL